jgi:copper(I)-binding protein
LIIFSSVQYVAAENASAIKGPVAEKKDVLDVRVTNAFIYVPLGNNKTTTAFFTITNHSNNDVTINAVTSSSIKEIKLMPKSPLVVPAHETLTLKPNSSFLQMNELKNPLKTGDELHLILSLSNGQKLQIVAVAKSAYDQIHGH